MKNYSFLLLICLIFKASLVHTMDNDNPSGSIVPAGSPDFMRDSRALLTPAGRERTYDEIERSPNVHHEDKKLERSSTEVLCINAKSLAIAARKKRGAVIDSSSTQLDIKVQLLSAQKQIERQIEVVKTVIDENKEAEKEKLRTYMSEAFIAIQRAEADELARLSAETEADQKMIEKLEEPKISAVASKSTPSSHDNQDINAVIAQIDEISAGVHDRQRNQVKRMPLSPRGAKIAAILEEAGRQFEKRPDATYEILLKHIQTDRALFLSKMHEELNASLHAGIEHMTKQTSHPHDYILFAVMLECGVDRTLTYYGKTLFDAAVNNGNELLVQLLATEHPTKQTLIDLAFEYHRDDLIPYLLSEEECIERACYYVDPAANNNNIGSP